MVSYRTVSVFRPIRIAESDQARAEAREARAEMEAARQEAEVARAEAEQADQVNIYEKVQMY